MTRDREQCSVRVQCVVLLWVDFCRFKTKRTFGGNASGTQYLYFLDSRWKGYNLQEERAPKQDLLVLCSVSSVGMSRGGGRGEGMGEKRSNWANDKQTL